MGSVLLRIVGFGMRSAAAFNSARAALAGMHALQDGASLQIDRGRQFGKRVERNVRLEALR
jgi:hypothetical protein